MGFSRNFTLSTSAYFRARSCVKLPIPLFQSSLFSPSAVSRARSCVKLPIPLPVNHNLPTHFFNVSFDFKAPPSFLIGWNPDTRIFFGPGFFCSGSWTRAGKSSHLTMFRLSNHLGTPLSPDLNQHTLDVPYKLNTTTLNIMETLTWVLIFFAKIFFAVGFDPTRGKSSHLTAFR